jgi:uncharacterized Zn finger protein
VVKSPMLRRWTGTRGYSKGCSLAGGGCIHEATMLLLGSTLAHCCCGQYGYPTRAFK